MEVISFLVYEEARKHYMEIVCEQIDRFETIVVMTSSMNNAM